MRRFVNIIEGATEDSLLWWWMYIALNLAQLYNGGEGESGKLLSVLSCSVNLLKLTL